MESAACALRRFGVPHQHRYLARELVVGNSEFRTIGIRCRLNLLHVLYPATAPLLRPTTPANDGPILLTPDEIA